jgi:predicted nuclease with TOPRIM domain
MRKKELEQLLEDLETNMDVLNDNFNFLRKKYDELHLSVYAIENVLKASGIIEALELNEDYIKLPSTWGSDSVYKVNEVF